MNPAELVPKHKLDLERAEAAVAAGYPAVASVLPELLTWLQDMNWPVARVLAPFLAGIGAPLEISVREVLDGTDHIWKYWVIREVIAKSTDLRRSFQTHLERLASQATDDERAEELDELARTLLEVQFRC
ncbi:MAG: DUF5071 domain-containing protein [Pseudomonadota bacterium]|nr:DUF5071 domain-containing protein [Pseudomonadota bacterium]